MPKSEELLGTLRNSEELWGTPWKIPKEYKRMKIFQPNKYSCKALKCYSFMAKKLINLLQELKN